MVHQVKASPFFSGSIAHTLGRLLLWSERPTRGLARVEFYSEFARQIVMQKLTKELQRQGIKVREIRLPLWGSPAQVLNFLLDELVKAESGVVSIVGFETAFNPEHLQPALGVLNFNREHFAQFHGRQIWWLSQDFLNRVINFMPDLNSWFTLRLSLTELTEKSQKSSENLVLVGDLNAIANGRSKRSKQWQNLPNSGIAQFVGREEYLIEIEHILATDHRVVLQGMGGCGKSELALQYAWRQWHNQHYGGGICWLNAFEGDLGLQILNFVYARLGLVTPTDGVLTERVALCWQNWPAGQVLIIIDDLRDYGIIEPYLPPLQETRFKVIITTRFNYLRHTIKTINLEILAPESAINLLSSYVTDDRINQQLEPAKSLCQDLGYLPLALELVARLLRHQKNLTIQEVREQLKEQGLADQSLQKNSTFDAEITAQNGVKEAFDLSWEILDSHAQNLAMYLSLFALAPFSKSLIDALLSEQDPENLEAWLTGGLMNLSLVNDLGDDWYELHPLIRVYLREKLEASPLKEEAKRAYGRVMVGIAKTIDQTLTLADIANLEPYIDHLKVAAEEFNQWLDNDGLIFPFVALGRFYRGKGLYQQAVFYLERCLTFSEKRLGQDHPDVATILNNLAELYQEQGKYEEAELLYRQLLTIDEKNYGENHLDFAISLNNLATLYKIQKKYDEAESLFLRSISIFEHQLKENLTYIAVSLNNLAELYEGQGKYEKAEPLYPRSLSIRESQLGENHPDVAESLNNLAVLYQFQGKYAEAEPLFLRSLSIREKQLGENHPDVAQSLNNLALLYESQGKYEEAEPLYLRSLAIDEKVYGEDHPEIATDLNNLAALYGSQGKYAEAEPLYLRSLAIREKQLGENHPTIATSLNNLAELYRVQGKYEEMEPLRLRCLEIERKTLGENHPQFASSLNNLALLYKSQGKYEEAEPLYLRSLAIWEKQLGENHPDAATSLNNLAGLYDSQGKYAEAEPLYQRSLAIREKQLGENHPDVANSLNNLAGLYQSQGKYEEAEPLYQKAIAIFSEKLGENHPNTQAGIMNYYQMLAKLPDDELNQRFPREVVEMLQILRQAL